MVSNWRTALSFERCRAASARCVTDVFSPLPVCGQAGGNKTGPNLSGIVGRTSGSVAGFSYSAANKGSGACTLSGEFLVLCGDAAGAWLCLATWRCNGVGVAAALEQCTAAMSSRFAWVCRDGLGRRCSARGAFWST